MFIRRFHDMKIDYKLWGGFSAILVLTGVVGVVATVTISDLSGQSRIAGTATGAIALLQKVGAAREAYLAAPSDQAAGQVERLADNLKEQLADMNGRAPEEAGPAFGVGGAIRQVETLETAFAKLETRKAGQRQKLDNLGEAGNRLAERTALISSIVGEVQLEAAEAAKAAAVTQAAARELTRHAEVLHADAEGLAARFGHGADFKQKNMTDEIRSEIDAALARMEGTASKIESTGVTGLEAGQVERVVTRTRSLAKALPDFLAETNLFNRMGKKKSVADLVRSVEQSAQNLRFASYEVLDRELAVAAEDQRNLTNLLELSGLAIRLANAASTARADTLEFLSNSKLDTAPISREIEELSRVAALLDTRTELAEAFSAAGPVEATVDRFRKAFAEIVATQRDLVALQGQLESASEAAGRQITELASRQGRDIQLGAKHAQTVIVAAVLAAVLLGIALAAVLNSAITRPIRSLTSVMSKLASGENNTEIPGLARRDEIGDMSRTVRVFRENALEREWLVEQREREELQRLSRQQAVETMISSFRETVRGVLASVGQTAAGLDETARMLTRTAQESAEKSCETEAAAGIAGRNVSMVATAAEELTTSIAEISSQVGRTTEVVERATRDTRLTNSKVAGLAEAASRIGEVVTLIQAIAEKTNLLALNATIEAARAGDVGRGFAVVAAEVKELANQTAKATEEISGQIAAIQSATQDSVGAIAAITRTMDEVNSYTGAIAAAVAQQGAATREISQNVQQAADGTATVTANMTGLSGAVEQTAVSADHVVRAASELGGKTEELRREVDRFLSDVTAA